MDPVTLFLVGAGLAGLGLIAAALTNRAAERRARAWQRAADRFELTSHIGKTSPDLTIEGEVEGVEVRVGVITERLGNQVRHFTSVWATSVIVDGPAFRLREASTQWTEAVSSLERVEIGDPVFDPAFLLQTDEPRAFARLLTPARRTALARLPDKVRMWALGGQLELRWPGVESRADVLEAAIALVLDLALVGSSLRDAVCAVEGVFETESHEIGDRFRHAAKELARLTARLEVQDRRPRLARPTLYQLDIERCVVFIRVTYWRGEPGLCFETETSASLPRFAVRWDRDGEPHGDPPAGLELVMDTRPPGGEALVKYDGETLRLYVREPQDPDMVREQAAYLGRIASAPLRGGAFR